MMLHGQILLLLSMVRDNRMSLEEEYANDPKLLKFYQENLLEPEWAGELSRNELAYIKSELKKSPSLKRRWGFRPSAKRFSESRIRDVARNGVPAKKRSVLASVVRGEKSHRPDISPKRD